MQCTTSEENYLKCIYHLQGAEGKVTTNSLAEALQTSPASVTDMTKKLNAKKLLHYKPYHGFSLSPEGRKTAVSVIRRHRLWECFLAIKLGFNWSEVHSIAEELEHVGSKALIDRLDEYLGYPRFDPHGDPIPDQKGRISVPETLSVFDLPIGKPGEVCQVTHQSPDMLELLEHKQIRLGTRLEVRKRFSFDQTLELKLGSNTITISEQLAKNIYVYG